MHFWRMCNHEVQDIPLKSPITCQKFSNIYIGTVVHRLTSSVALYDCSDHVDVLAPADSLITWKRGDAVRLRMTESGVGSEKPRTVMTEFRTTVERFPNNLALGEFRRTENVDLLKWA